MLPTTQKFSFCKGSSKTVAVHRYQEYKNIFRLYPSFIMQQKASG